MMSPSYVKQYFVVCYLVSYLVINAVAGISLDYYFGNGKRLRSAGNILVKDCGTAAMRYHCYEKCGLQHACLLGQCFCVKISPSPEEDEDLTEEESSVEDITGEEFFDEDEEDALEPLSDEESNNVDEESNNVDGELVDRPALRHHIAHFCPNLDKARECIRKCMKLSLPAFCGKDHICYCGHKDENTKKDLKTDPSVAHNQFKDLYEKYFGNEISIKKSQVKHSYKHNQ